MLFTFHLARGDLAGCTIESHQVTAWLAIKSLRRMTRPGSIPRVALRDVDHCYVAEEPDHSPTNAEMLQAAESVTRYFWRELRHCVDVTVQMLENN